MRESLEIYNFLKTVPDRAKKKIMGGRLQNMTDISPMWRIEKLTERFGACGIGWYYEITEKWLEAVGDETKCFVQINLFIKVDGEWSKPIPGLGGSSFVTMEKVKAYVNDECYKMALTDALGVAGKALGLGADVYAEHGGKYTSEPYKKPAPQPQKQPVQPQPTKENAPVAKITKEQAQNLFKFIEREKIDTNTAKTVIATFGFKGSADITVDKYEDIFDALCEYVEGGNQ